MSPLKTKLKNLLSRKFLVAVAGAVMGVVTAAKGPFFRNLSISALLD
jgi:hypothetical protein